MSRGVDSDCTDTLIAHTLKGEGFDAGEDGTGRGTPLVPCEPYTLAIRGRAGESTLEARQDGTANAILTPNGGRAGIGVGAVAIPFDTTQMTSKANRSQPKAGDPCHPLAAGAHPPAIAFHNRQDPDVSGDVTHPLGAKDNGMAVAFDWQAGGSGDTSFRGKSRSYIVRKDGKAGSVQANKVEGVFLPQTMAVRRLTPRECERLQGFGDDYTLVPYRGKPAADGPRYKALGNSMAVPCMSWLGRRIEAVDAMPSAEIAA